MMTSIEDVVKKNRDTLSSVKSFIDDVDYYESPDKYGLPTQVYHLLNLPIDNKLTYVDLIMFLQAFLKKESVSYVEIGVSVLKTFYQIANFLQDSKLYAFDINKINPTIEEKFSLIDKVGQISRYNYNTNNISHFQGDVFNVEDFGNFKNHVGSKVNIIFSDACHTGPGLQSEYDLFIKDSLDDDFILYYDDLDDSEMRGIFFKIAGEYMIKDVSITSALLRVNGWLGQYEHAHLNGIITSLDLKKIFGENNILSEISFLEFTE